MKKKVYQLQTADGDGRLTPSEASLVIEKGGNQVNPDKIFVYVDWPGNEYQTVKTRQIEAFAVNILKALKSKRLKPWTKRRKS